MKLGIILSTAEPETAFNVFRLGNFSIQQGDLTKIFLFGKGVDIDNLPAEAPFDVPAQAKEFLLAGGDILACGTCLKLRQSEGSEICPISTMKDLYSIIAKSDKILSF